MSEHRAEYVRHYTCRDIGYGVEEGEYYWPPLNGPDWTGKRPFATPVGHIVYLFDDELEAES
jgi:hypothetical protein